VNKGKIPFSEPKASSQNIYREKKSGIFMPQQETLLFVSNNDSGVLPKIKNYSSDKAVSPAVSCNLSVLIHSPVGIKKEWKRFMKEQKIPSRFLDRNEFRAEFGPGVTKFPVVFIRIGKSLSVLINTDEINRCRELEELISLFEKRLHPGLPTVS
jgi:hypothetical protein